jgi:hypothetical protein
MNNPLPDIVHILGLMFLKAEEYESPEVALKKL